MTHKIILDWSEDRIRDDYMNFKVGDLSLGNYSTELAQNRALDKLHDKVYSMPLEKIINDKKYLKSFKDTDLINDIISEEKYKVGFKSKNKE